MWKILAVITAVLLGGAGYFGLQNRKVTTQLVKDLAKAKDTLVARQSDLSTAKEKIVTLNQSIVALEDETEKLNAEKIDYDNKVLQVNAELGSIESQIETTMASLDRARAMTREFNTDDLDSIRRQMAETRTLIEEAEIQKVKKQGAIAFNQVENDRIAKAAAEMRALRVDQDAGVIRGEFETTVARSYNNWGFVVVNGGNDQGVVNNAQLDVYRGGRYLCKLLVTQVEANQSVADIVPGSLQPGRSVSAGDLVVKSVEASTVAIPAVTSGPLPSVDDAAPVLAPTPEPEPFGGSADPDPFGGSADPDPFGSPAADPFGSDPFGG